MSTPARRRLLRDLKRISSDPPTGIIANPDANDLLVWHAVIFGPEDTPWEGGTFKLRLQFLEEYPNRPPVVKFVTKLFHPNIYSDGAICLDILANQWSPIYDVSAILASIQSLLTDPNPNSPANVEAAKLYVENRREYDRKVAEVIEQLWKLEEAEKREDGDSVEDDEEDDEEDAEAAEDEEEPKEDADAAPRKKQKISETEAKHSNAPQQTQPAAETAASAAAASAAASSSPAAAQ